MTSKACCTIPPVVASNYTPKGTFSEFAGMKTYVTGDKNAKTAVLIMFDIFGFSSQIYQGADIIATSGSHLVVLPDFFLGESMDNSLYPPDTEEKKAKILEFVAGAANMDTAQENLKRVLPVLKSAYPIAENWGVIGFCWGGKVATLMSGPSTPFKVSVQVHPAMISPDDAAKLSIPHLCLASADEPADAVAEVAEVIKNHPNEEVRTKSVVETYSTMDHGWMAARANLENEGNAREYARGYKQVVNFLQGNLAAAK